jgi:hypothetical protein
VGLAYEPVPVWPLYSRPERDNAARRTGRAFKRLLVERGLKDAARRQPLLSSSTDLGRALSRLDAALDRLREDAGRGSYHGLVPVNPAGDGWRRAGGG